MRVKSRRVVRRVVAGRAAGITGLVFGLLFAAGLCATATPGDNPVPNIFEPAFNSRRFDSFISRCFVLTITGVIFLVVIILLVYALVKFRARTTDSAHEPAPGLWQHPD